MKSLLIGLMWMLFEVCGSFGQVNIDQNLFVGCYSLNQATRDFNMYPALPDESLLTPSFCIRACYNLNYAFASVEASKYCFCSNNVILSPLASSCASKCNTLNLVCPGDNSKCCGSTTFNLVYSTADVGQVINDLEN